LQRFRLLLNLGNNSNAFPNGYEYTVLCSNVDQNLITDQARITSGLRFCKMVRKLN